jgi:hypothetical protein
MARRLFFALQIQELLGNQRPPEGRKESPRVRGSRGTREVGGAALRGARFASRLPVHGTSSRAEG